MDQCLQRLAPRGGKAGILNPFVNLVARLRQGQLQRLLIGNQDLVRRLQRVTIRDKLRALRLKRGDIVLRGVAFGGQGDDLSPRPVAFGQKRGDLRLEIGDTCCGGAQVLRQPIAFGLQAGNQGGLRICGLAGGVDGGIQPPNLTLQCAGPVAFQPERLRQRHDLGAQLVQFGFLPGDGFLQHELHDHKDRQNEHEHQKQAGHRINEAGPDRTLETVS